MLRHLHNTQGRDIQVGPEMNSFGYKCYGVEVADDTYLLNTTLPWVVY